MTMLIKLHLPKDAWRKLWDEGQRYYRNPTEQAHVIILEALGVTLPLPAETAEAPTQEPATVAS